VTTRESDQQLVQRAQRGDTRAFDLLVLKYQGRIATLVARFVNDPAEVEDVTQEAFIKAFRALDKFRGESAFYTWLYRIASNAAKNYLTTRSRRPTSDAEIEDAVYFDEADALRDDESPESHLFGEEMADAVQGVLDGLPEELRMALVLREIDGLSYEDIAEVMECPVGTVRSRIFRARDAIDLKVRAQLLGD
jgi:RNA polymerase sigma-70 factor (ECF subfamily)